MSADGHEKSNDRERTLSDVEANQQIDAHLQEQDEGILRAFALADQTVLTTAEIEEYVDLSERQL